MRSLSCLAVLAACLSLVSPTRADKPVEYLRDVKPLLSRRCQACHGPLKQEAGLRLDAGRLIARGGDNGRAVVPGKASDSPLIQRITAGEDERMPPEGKALTAEEIAVLRAWVNQGAGFPDDEAIVEDPRQHWSFQIPLRPPVPPLNIAGGNAIDAFLAAQRQEKGLVPRPVAPKHVLLRRVFLDLIGIPPSRGELRTFLADESPDAYDKVVDRLLNDPRHGERWGRHWMDVWRYSDWYGRRSQNEIRYSQYHIWRWRDWIVESVNADKGYDRMLVEMLAGDEAAPGDPDVLRATGFLGRNWYKFDRNVWMAETIEQTSVGFLALTMKCARCHDHKYDPISQLEYYRLRAFFEPHGCRIDPVAAGRDPAKDGLARVYDSTPDAPTYFFHRGDDRSPDKEHPLTAAVPTVFTDVKLKIEPVALPVADYYPALRPEAVAAAERRLRADVTSAENALAQAREQADRLEKRLSGEPEETPPVEAAAASLFADDFSMLQPETWQVVSGKWECQEGRLVQSEVGSFRTLVSQFELPRDFQARIQYRTTETGTTRSVGMSFDVTEDRSEYQAIYTHISGGNPAIHAFHRQAGRDVYPLGAIVPHPLKLNEWVTLDFAVQGQLLNVWMDGQLKLVWKMPMARRPGRFAFWVHNGTADFDDLRIESLPESHTLAENVGVSRPSPFGELTETDLKAAWESAKAAVPVEQSRLQLALAEFGSLKARVLADRAKVSGGPDAKSLAKEASLKEREAKSAQVHLNLLLAEREASRTTDEKVLKKLADARKAAESAAANLKTESETYTALGTSYPKTSTGRRLALARWIASAKNPRTARVAVNHVWLRHFGKALVPSVANFGLAGKPPTHPELLDWLAAELTDSGWSMKQLHRLIVTSSAYRMASSPGQGESNLAIDPDNRFLWRMNSRRMEAEVVRDSLLSAAGSLDTTMGGPELDDTSGQTSGRRSLYFRTTPDNKMELLELFDLANPNECYRRQTSVVPQQALAMANSTLALTASRKLGRQLHAACPSDDAFITRAFEQILSHPPSNQELASCRRFLAEHAMLLKEKAGLTAFSAAGSAGTPPSSDPQIRARENLVHVLFNHNEFITVR